MNGLPNWPNSTAGWRRYRTKLARLLAERIQRREATLRAAVQAAKQAKTLTPEAVAAFAALHIADDEGLPITPMPHHGLWLQLMCDTRIPKLLIVAPPESAKTTWALSAFVGCYVGFFPEHNVIVASSSGDVARRRSLSLRTMVESPRWRTTFPGVLPARGLTWEQTEWSLAPDGVARAGRLHPTVAAYGTGGSITGARGDLIVADDVLDFDNTRTAHQRGVVTLWFYNSLLSRLKGGAGRILVIGTSWTHDDIYAHLREESDWVICHLPLLSPSAAVRAYLTYPVGWPHEPLGEPLGQPVEALLGVTDDADV